AARRAPAHRQEVHDDGRRDAARERADRDAHAVALEEDDLRDLAARDADLTANPALVDDLHRLICTSPVPVTDDPERTLIQGSSLGGLAALFAQCIAPDRFGASVCQSGSFWWPNA